ncbi:unnamed protein product [Penicillium viridicatum]
MDKLATKTVGVIGTGASANSILYYGPRELCNHPANDRSPRSKAGVAEGAHGPVLRGARSRGVRNVKNGTVAEGFDALSLRKVLNGMRKGDVGPEQMGDLYARADISLMESIRKHISNTVDDQETAKSLSHGIHFFASGQHSTMMELVDTNGQGVSCLTEKGVVANGKEHEVDLLIYATGFDYEIGTPFY